MSNRTAPKNPPKLNTPVIVLLTVGLGICLILLPTLIAFIAPVRSGPIKEIAFEGARYFLTCIPTWDGPVELTLHKCKDKFDESCTEVGYAKIDSVNCDSDIILHATDGKIEVVDPHGIMRPLLISYDPNQ